MPAGQESRASAEAVPFRIHIEEDVLHDLHTRLAMVRWPRMTPSTDWADGVDSAYLRRLVDYWRSGYDWRSQESLLNRYQQYTMLIDGLRVHYVHHRARNGSGIPLLLGHGWPSTFAEYLPLVRILTEPKSVGLPGPAFDVIVPSLPGYGFSDRPDRRDVNYRFVADLWHRLMRNLGYQRFGVGGDDFGAGVATLLALEHPESVIGVHLTHPEITPYLGPGAPPLTDAETAYREEARLFYQTDSGFHAIQATRPTTLAYGLDDSPVGLAAWIVDKWHAWTDHRENFESYLSRDLLLTTIMIYWATGTLSTSIRDYSDNTAFPPALTQTSRVTTPTAFALFRNYRRSPGVPPREWLERLYDVTRYQVFDRGGHFAPVEVPKPVAEDIVRFFAEL
ncbi:MULTISPECIES: epoxide hydrolase family protein [Actinoalloteichus]|uniref:Hydrolase or acyltransferase of alpha/beta superfamily n=1 Tax=Actinoalloteichus fjordicus TaxID=1612552 RepID=A0AAC9L8M7_9PSEU|nr:MULTISPECIES: epoxide hydrolase family protein [Actinoalloteichus]APU13428.1 putative hydrolase or acyltransferase of alpha/beta superfamily [Actinoalloteichus fjordicus]APU19377.1 putative hydrolase or acyltransferase of alpha/beta superfamily [Actinoalloteichus sp. GBA129-24]